MYGLGIDAGLKTTKAVLLDENGNNHFVLLPGELLATDELANHARSLLFEEAGIGASDIVYTVSTGSGKTDVSFRDETVPEVICLAQGIQHFSPSTRTLVDLGLRNCYLIKCRDGRIDNMTTGTKCAAGTGSYLDLFSNFLKLDLNTMSDMYFKSDSDYHLQTRCAIFAETEVISLIHSGYPKEDIVRSIFQSLARQVAGLLFGLGIDEDLTVTGGVANSPAFIHALQNETKVKVHTLEQPQIVAAMGAAKVALERGRNKK